MFRLYQIQAVGSYTGTINATGGPINLGIFTDIKKNEAVINSDGDYVSIFSITPGRILSYYNPNSFGLDMTTIVTFTLTSSPTRGARLVGSPKITFSLSYDNTRVSTTVNLINESRLITLNSFNQVLNNGVQNVFGLSVQCPVNVNLKIDNLVLNSIGSEPVIL